MRILLAPAAGWALAGIWCAAVAAQQAPPDPIMRIWTGVYSNAQAERGKAAYSAGCTDCHGFDLSGGAGPALSGPGFMTKWEGENLNSLFRKIRDSMPRNDPGRLTDQATVEIVAFILQSNGIPSGNAQLRANGETLSEFAIIPKTGPTRRSIPNFALVAVVGCLSGADRAWTLSQATDPRAAKDTAATPAELREAASASGTQAYRLVSVLPFQPAPHGGHKVYVRGLINRTAEATLLNVTGLQGVSETCGR
ncbi:MAG: cytochrome c [Acidobacteria bacterium]|nr:cytochrome c [Acidobacteriota bacterium]